MNRIFLLFKQVCSLAFLCNVANAQTILSVEIKNNAPIPINKKVIEIPWQDDLIKITDTARLIVIDAESKDQLVFQLETKGLGQIQNLLVQLDFKENQTKRIVLKYGKRDDLNTKTYGRFIPERKDDFAWENNRIAFRMYGKALEMTPKENAYGLDVWVKRTERMIINERYKRNEYHIDHGDGMDYYHVGFTLGAGNMMPYLKDSIWYSKNYTTYKVLDNGPLRTSFQLSYDDWDVDGQMINAEKTISLDADQQLNKISVRYNNIKDSTLPVVAGIVCRKAPGIKLLDEVNGIMAYWEPKHGVDGITGVACVFSTPVQQLFESKGQLLGKIAFQKGETLTYYAGAVWDKAGFIIDENSWFQYLKQFNQEMNASLDLKVIH